MGGKSELRYPHQTARSHNPEVLILVLEVKRREKRFSKAEWKRPGLELPEENREGIRRVLGFWIGEGDPTDLFDLLVGPGVGVVAAATGPP
jgi:hypothetical protein